MIYTYMHKDLIRMFGHQLLLPFSVHAHPAQTRSQNQSYPTRALVQTVSLFRNETLIYIYIYTHTYLDFKCKSSCALLQCICTMAWPLLGDFLSAVRGGERRQNSNWVPRSQCCEETWRVKRGSRLEIEFWGVVGAETGCWDR